MAQFVLESKIKNCPFLSNHHAMTAYVTIGDEIALNLNLGIDRLHTGFYLSWGRAHSSHKVGEWKGLKGRSGRCGQKKSFLPCRE
jgi:hypothetical protein